MVFENESVVEKSTNGFDNKYQDVDVPSNDYYIPPEPSLDDVFGQGISSGINFDAYSKTPVQISGENPPPQATDFATSGLSEFLLANVRKSGYAKPTPIQAASIPAVLDGRDLMACSQTGSGKTAAYLLPIIQDLLTDTVDLTIGRPQVVIVSPTRELAIQIYREALKFATGSYLKVCICYGGTSTWHQSGNLAKGAHILVATPGRLLDFVDRAYVTFEDVRYAVLDEADRMLDMGFLPTIRKMMNHSTMVAMESRRTLMFSATFPMAIQQLASQFLNPNYIFVSVGIISGACTDVVQTVQSVGKFEKRNRLMDVLNDEDPIGTIVFVETKRQADFLASFLSESKHPTTSIHGDRLQRQREQALDDFRRNRMKVLVATSVAARGLDIPNVRHVVNYDMPKEIDEYVHRIGRTGRVGNRGRATTFFDTEVDASVAGDLCRVLEESKQDVPEFLREIGGCGFDGSAEVDVRGGFNGYQEPEEEW